MTEIREAPVDYLGVPKPIIPSKNFASLELRSPSLSTHHEFFLFGPKTFTTPSSRAMRHSRLLRTERRVHNEGPMSFHNFFNQCSGPPDEASQFKISVLSLAGYLPEEGIDLWSGVPVVRKIEEDERAILMEPHPSDGSRYRNIYYHNDGARDFFLDYTKHQDPSDICPEAIREFLSTSKISEVRDSGFDILSGAMKKATMPIEGEYQLARKAGLLHPLAPETAQGLVAKILENEKQKEKNLQYFWQRLANVALQTEVNTVELAA